MKQPAGGPVISSSRCAAKCCSNEQNFILNSSGGQKSIKTFDVEYFTLCKYNFFIK